MILHLNAAVTGVMSCAYGYNRSITPVQLTVLIVLCLLAGVGWLVDVIETSI